MVSELESRASDKRFLPVKLGNWVLLTGQDEIWCGVRKAESPIAASRIPDRCKPILERLGLDREVCCELVRNFGKLFGRVTGKPDSLKQSAAVSGIAQRRSGGGPAMIAG